eukprot:CAMPEP_0197464934 /NCGR_PEP_ID=MMETSP1175-20131217/64284_1 /TAXON_ID=1003142 /ORGANISM="Triceratium dubium, Strain CCMP147" /LENGTH=171 /DNA_ID=CAMNT_0043000937 /DNA_START=393 /DNA_END=905 /DNA_ORIENTATION=-
MHAWQAPNSSQLCDDGLFCNGLETCDPSTGQCTPGTAPNCDDGISCTVDSCSDSLGKCTHTGGTNIKVTLTTDEYPGETSWTLTGPGLSVSSLAYSEKKEVHVSDLFTCDPGGQYTFTIDDSYGDGICCKFGSGSYVIEADGEEKASGGAFTNSETKIFTAGAPPPQPTPP